jgi:hypothetical protein
MAVTWDRILALLIAIGWGVAAGFVAANPWVGLMTFVLFLLPVALICFADEIGRGPGDPGPKLTILGYYKRRTWNSTGADRPSPPGCLVGVGWFLLTGMPVLILLIGQWARNPR